MRVIITSWVTCLAFLVSTVLTAGCPGIPKNADPKRLQVIRRLDMRPANPVKGNGVPMDGLNQLLKDMGGRHVDVLVGTNKKCFRFDLRFLDTSWKNYPNADGAPIKGDQRDYNDISPQQKLQYMGELKKGTNYQLVLSTLKSIITQFKTYDHKERNCVKAADRLIAALKPTMPRSGTPDNRPKPGPAGDQPKPGPATDPKPADNKPKPKKPSLLSKLKGKITKKPSRKLRRDRTRRTMRVESKFLV